MQNGFYSAVGGMVTQFNKLDTISNNLANINTNGFKRDDVVIGDFLRLYQEFKHNLPLENHTREAAKFLNRTLDRVPIVVEEYTDMNIGNFTKTDNPLDFALSNKDAFFAIQTPNGVRYTRDGSFELDNNGVLVTKQGYPVLSADGIDNNGYINIDISSNNLEISKDGNIFVRELDNANIGNPQQIGTIAIVSFINPKYLQKIGNNMYDIPLDKLEERRNIINQNVLVSGFIEKSNINAVSEMTALISTNRLVDMYSKVMKTHQDDLNTESINKLAQKA